jgi:hypothetical protein
MRFAKKLESWMKVFFHKHCSERSWNMAFITDDSSVGKK